jgi:hypothetical protein
MSMLMPIGPGQREKWREPRPEPVELQLSGEWRVEHIIEPDDVHPNRRITIWRNGAARIELTRTWVMPLNPGYPMQTASTRLVAGRDVQTTSMFDGAPKEVQLTWLRGNGHGVAYLVRVVFDGCNDATVEDVLAKGLIVAW